MRVAHLTALLGASGGGIPPAVLPLVAAQRQVGIAARAFGADDGSPLTNGTVDCEVLPMTTSALGYAASFLPRVQAFRPDIVHLHGLFSYASVVARRVLRQDAARLIVSPHGMLDGWALARSRIKKRVFRMVIEDANLKSAGYLHALCESESAALRALGLRNPILICPNGIEPAKYPRPEDIAQRFQSAVPQAEGRKTVLFMARIHPKKGLLPLIEAWARLRSDGILKRGRWLLVVAGPDQIGHEAEMMSKVRSLSLEGDVRFVGPRYGEDKLTLLWGVDAFVLPSFSEGFPIAALEALVCSRPALLSPQCNFPAAASAGAALVASPTAEALGRGLGSLLEMTDSQRVAMGERGRALVFREYTWAAIAPRVANCYEAMLSGGPQTSGALS
jgi:glycosyltransferase involved in cell wall biosynthesis